MASTDGDKMYKLCLAILLMLQLVASAWAQEAPQTVRIAVKEFPPLVFKDQRGFAIDMARAICRKNNLTPEFVYYDSVPEVLHAVETGACDLNLSGITITAEREKRVDFSHPFFDSGLMVAVLEAPLSSLWVLSTAVLRVIGLSIIVFLIGLSVVAHLIWLIERNDQDPKGFPKRYRQGIIDAYWWAIVTMTTVGYGDKCPKKIVGRMIAAVWMIIGIIWFAAFTATLTSALTINKLKHGEISGLTDLAQRTVAVIKDTTSEEYMLKHDVTVMMVETYDDLIINLKTGVVDAIVYDAPVLMHAAKFDPDIQVVGQMFDEQRYGAVFPHGPRNRLKEIFNIAILQMQDSGEYERLYRKWF
jgi:ABC-type amino acid transport substrate-binding protein